MEMRIRENIKRLRAAEQLDEKALAELCGVSEQTVKDWENGSALPETAVLPKLSEALSTSLDSLFFAGSSPDLSEIPVDEQMYIVQVVNGKVLSEEKWDAERPIMLEVPPDVPALIINVRGNAEFTGEFSGSLTAGECISCDMIRGSATAGSTIECDRIAGQISSGDNISCGSIVGNVASGCSINCGTINGDIKCSGDVHCGEIKANHIEGRDIHCSSLISCPDIGGRVFTDEEE